MLHLPTVGVIKVKSKIVSAEFCGREIGPSQRARIEKKSIRINKKLTRQNLNHILLLLKLENFWKYVEGIM